MKQKLCTAQQIKDWEREAIEKEQIPSLVLMERAALCLLSEMPNTGSIAIVCGNGNNGADGLCLARLLLEQKRYCTVFVTENGRRTEEYEHQMKRLRHAGFDEKEIRVLNSEIIATFSAYSVIVDAIFGVGLNRPVEGRMLTVIQEINRAKENGSFVVAVDIPSGIDATSGKVLGDAIHADKTVTFSCNKTGMVLYPGRMYAGQVIVGQIGLPEILKQDTLGKFFTFDGPVAEHLPVRKKDSHKGTYGTVAVIAGSKDMPGAATLCTKAAYRCGAGIVKLISEKETVTTVRQTVPEVITIEETDDLHKVSEQLQTAKSVVIGPGLAQGERTEQLVDAALTCGKPLIVDADALNCMAGRLDKITTEIDERISLLNTWLPSHAVLTPHKKELSRLLNLAMSELTNQWTDIMHKLQASSHFVTVMKDACTAVVSADGIYLNQSGNSGMSTGGSGDVLAGITGALLCTMAPMEAACAAVYLHGCLGDEAAKIHGEYGMMASDMIEAMKNILA